MESSKKFLTIREIVLCALFSALIAVGAFIKIPVPLVPFTLQFLFTNLAGLILGKRLGAISVAIYIAIGLAGLPIFTAGGGLSYIFQPTFGYIIGFFIGTFVAGFIAERAETRSFKVLLTAGFVNIAIIYAIGMVYYFLIANYYTHSPISVKSLFLYCFLLFVPGDILTCFVSAVVCKRITPVLAKIRA